MLCALFLVFLGSCSDKKTEIETIDIKYQQELSTLSFQEGVIKGRLMHPIEKDHETLIIIVPGSGRMDLNGNIKPTFNTNNLLMISEFLADEGYYTLRYDKRGVGESSEIINTESDIDFHNSVDDVVKWVEKYSKDPRFKRIVLFGHSEGALIASQVSIMSEEIDALISVAAIAIPADQVILERLQAQSEELYELSIPIIEELKIGNMVTRVPFALFDLFRPSVQPYLISLFDFIPIEIARQVEVPTLIIHGNRDININESHGKLLHQEIPHSKLVIVSGMNHVLKHATSDKEENMSTYTNPELPIHEKFKDEVLLFLSEIIKE